MNFFGKNAAKEPSANLAVEICELDFIPISLKLPNQSEKERLTILTEEGEFLPGLAPLSASGTKGRSGNIKLPAVSDEELKIQTAKADCQAL